LGRFRIVGGADHMVAVAAQQEFHAAAQRYVIVHDDHVQWGGGGAHA
jgi:hypothetical protein